MKKLVLSLALALALLVNGMAALATALADADILAGSLGAARQSAVEGRAIAAFKDEAAAIRVGADEPMWRVEPLMTLSGSSGEGMEGAVLALVQSDALSTAALIEALTGRADVLYAEPDYVIAPLSEVEIQPSGAEAASEASGDIPDFSALQYSLDGEYGIGVPGWNSYDDQGLPTPEVNAEGTVVAVMDMGVDYNHTELRDIMWDEGLRYEPLTAMGGGQYGFNACAQRGSGEPYDSADPMDDGSHGTHCAGVIAARWDHRGISGAAVGSRIMAVKVMNDVGWGESSEYLRGFEYIAQAMRCGVPVKAVNCSWSEESIQGRAMDMAIREIGALGAVTVFAAGNEYRDIDYLASTHNAFRYNPYVVVVGSVGQAGYMSESSCYGKRTVDVFAPGDAIFSSVVTDSGTADPYAQATRADGAVFNCDYEAQQIENGADNGVFGFAGDEMSQTVLDIAREGFDSAHALHVKNAEGMSSNFVLTSRLMDVPESARGLVLKLKAQPFDSMTLMVNLMGESGEYVAEETYGAVVGEQDGWKIVASRLPERKAEGPCAMVLNIDLYANEPMAEGILIDDVRFVDGMTSYDFMSGTSMAAPHVTAGAAILAAAFPEDDAAMRAARIRGSVRPVEDLADFCTSGGVFRVDAALRGETAPVPASLEAAEGTAIVTGCFFGEAEGALTIGGQPCQVLSWSDGRIEARLPENFAGGDVEVAVTAADGKQGREYLPCPGTRKLMRRLALPGRSVAGDPGVYEVLPESEDDEFFASQPVALVGLDGDLYCLMACREEKGLIYRYDIADGTWSRVCEAAGVMPTGGACAWQDKLLFIGGSIADNRACICEYDPRSQAIEITDYSDEACELYGTLADTGSDVLMLGGVRRYFDSGFIPYVEIVRFLDPQSRTVRPAQMDEGVIMPYDNYVAWTDGEAVHVVGGNANGVDFCRLDVDGDRVTIAIDKREMFVGEEYPMDQAFALTGGMGASGLMLYAPVALDDAEQVASDTYLVAADGSSCEPLDRVASLSVVYDPCATVYEGRFYLIGVTNSENGGWVFCDTEAR